MTKTVTPAWLSSPETKILLAAFAKEHVPLRFVGGCVRDALLGVTAQDIDAATPLTPDRVMMLLQSANIKAIPTGIDHGTVTALVDKKPFEITTLRRDVETDGRHAHVEYTDDWREDAARRDFTINAFYLSSAGELFDYFEGIEDLQKGAVRFIGDAEARIQEDCLRILRFFRFHAYYGKIAPDAAALAACKKFAPRIKTLSGERIRQEVLKLLAVRDPRPVLALMQQQGVSAYVSGGDIDPNVLAPLLKLENTPQPLVRLAALLGDAKRAAEIGEMWRLSNQEQAEISAALKPIPANASLAEQKAALYERGERGFVQAVLASAALTPSPCYESMLHLPQRWKAPPFPVSGDDLKKCGFVEGKSLGDALKRLEKEWQASDYTLSKEQLLAKAK